MVNHPNRGARGPGSTPTPAEIRAARAAAGHTQRQAAETVFATERAWAEWEADRGEGQYPGRRMHPATFLLYRALCAGKASEAWAILKGKDGYHEDEKKG